MRIPLILELDDESDAAYVVLAGPIEAGEARTQVVVDDDRLRGEIIIDLDPWDNVLGIEFVGWHELTRPEDRQLRKRLRDGP